ncbi:MAG: DHHA1 domain-containing protein, partial [Acidobacteriota bacterium]
VDVIITCDTGSTAHRAVEFAQAAGVDVLITDHHMLGDTLPAAHAVINPMRLPAGHALRDLSGVGVAWQLMTPLLDADDSIALLDLVAIGIVADVATQARDTRYLLQRGLEVMKTTSRPGIRALFDRAQIDPLHLTEMDIGFKLGPRLNAQGRLGDAAACVELLTTDHEARAAELANQLEGMNARRKLETKMIEDGALSMIGRDASLLEYAVLVLSHPDWGSGVIGVVASRLADTYHKPVVLLSENEDMAFGSARSIPGCNITDAIRANRDLVERFGGHAMAAGLSLKKDAVFDFRRRLSRTVRELTKGTAEEPVLELDAYLGLHEVSLGLAEDIRRLAPFGNGNRELNLATRDLRLVRHKKLRQHGDGRELLVEDAFGRRQWVLWWKTREGDELPGGRFDLAYNLSISRFKKVEASLNLVDFRRLEQDSIEVEARAPALEIEDLSGVPDRRARLFEILEEAADAIVWRELDPTIEGCTRIELRRAETLLVWTAAPGHTELQSALKVVRPRRVIFFGERPEPMTVASFLRRLGGLAKHVIKRGGGASGETTVSILAAATAERDVTVRYGLRWWKETGRMEVAVGADDTVQIWAGPGRSNPIERPELEKLVQNALEETAAYRVRGQGAGVRGQGATESDESQ